MKKVYLDFNKWVDLARADRGDPSHIKFEDSVAIAVAGAQNGLALFPLSEDHYWETWAKGSAESRGSLSRFMLRLSGGKMVAGLRQLVPAEIDLSLSHMFGRPAEPRTCQVFGLSICEVCGEQPWRFVPPPGIQISPAQEARLDTLFQNLLLSGPPREVQIPGHDPQAHRPFGRRFAQEQTELVRSLSARHGHRKLEALRAKGIIDISGPLGEAMTRAGLPPDVLGSLDRDGLTELLRGIPTRWAEVEMLYQHHLNPRLPWRDNDLIDLVNLSIAIVYCDIVVAEKLWIDMARRARLDELYGTVLLTDVAALPRALAS